MHVSQKDTLTLKIGVYTNRWVQIETHGFLNIL